MTEQQINQTYNQLYLVEDDNEKRSVLKQLHTEAKQLGLKDWVRLIEARLAALNHQYDIAIDLSTSLLDCPELTSELRARALYNRGFVYGHIEPPRTEDEIADYTAVIEMPDAPAEQKAIALVNRGVRYSKLEPPRIENAIADYTAVIEMPDAPAEIKALALNNRGVAYSQLEPPRIENAIADYTAVIEMPDVPAKRKALALNNRGFAYSQLEPPRTKDEIADYTAVIEMPDAPAKDKARALNNRGVTYKQKGKPKKAKDDLLEAKKFSEQIGDKDRIKSVDFMLSRLDVPNKDLSQEDQEIIQAVSSAPATDKQLSVEDKIINEFTVKKTTVYDEYNKRRSSTYIKDTDAENEVILAGYLVV